MFNKKIKKVITIEGMMCEHCKEKVEKSVLKLDGITKVKVSLKDKTATIYSSVSIPDEDIIDTINKLDYKVTSIGKDE
ncbi:MAG: heavy-metal-associated domain-containing protein [Clostridium sp.]|nr:heavy-metal-associated domain-containing protein [Clostridium sp.]